MEYLVRPASVDAATGSRWSRKKNLGLLDLYSNRRCLVTGHTGFKGSWMCFWLQMLGARTTGYALEPPTDPSLFETARISNCAVDLRGDIRDYARLKDVIDDAAPEIVFHLAAQSLVRMSYAEPRATFEVNVGGTVNVLEALRHCPSVKAIVVITSDKCYENREWLYAYRETDPLGGHDPYSASKAGAELVCGAFRRSFFGPRGIGLASCRAGNVIGGGDWAQDRIIPDAVRAVSMGREVGVRNPSSIRPWQHVLEPLFGYLILGARMLEGLEGSPAALSGPWNFGPPVDSCQTVRELVTAFIEAYGSGTWQEVPSGEPEIPHEAELLALNWDKAYRCLGWNPQWDFRASVKRTGLWYRRHAEGADAASLCREDIMSYVGGDGRQ